MLCLVIRQVHVQSKKKIFRGLSFLSRSNTKRTILSTNEIELYAVIVTYCNPRQWNREPYSVRQYMVFVTYILYKTILGQRSGHEPVTKEQCGCDAFGSFQLWTLHGYWSTATFLRRCRYRPPMHQFTPYFELFLGQMLLNTHTYTFVNQLNTYER